MLEISLPIIVEGKYDRERVLSVAKATVITTDGFGIFKKDEKAALIRRLAAAGGVIVLTDSDGAGKLIRSHLTSCLPAGRLIQLYIPKIAGTERRKEHPSAEGTLGVEGMEQSLLYDLLAPYADEAAVLRAAENPLCKADLFEDGLTGCPDSAARRDAFAERLGLPAGMTPNAFLAALRVLLSYDDYLRMVGRE